MKKITIIITCLLAFVGIQNGMAQFETSSPSIPKQEYFNPAFNAYKTYMGLNIMAREQWTDGVSTAPKLYAVNLFFPLTKRGLGLGGNLVSEEVGLRYIHTAQFSASKGIRLSQDAYLALGVGIGTEFQSYIRSKMKYYPEVDITRVNIKQTHPALSVGLMALYRNSFLGVSTKLTMNDQDFDFKYITGFDFVGGRVFVITPDFVVRSMVVGKYYKELYYESNEGVIRDEYVKPVIDWSVTGFFYNKIWLGAGIRFGQAINVMANARVTPKISVGYKYEMGIGKNLNRFNSQGIYLTFNFKNVRRQYRGYNLYEGVFTKGRRRFKCPLNEYLY